MKRNFFLFLLLFFVTLTASVFVIAKDINFKQMIQRVSSAAVASAEEALKQDYKASSQLQDEDSPMMLHFAMMR